MIIAGNLGYAAWRDGGFTVHDIGDPRIRSSSAIAITRRPLPAARIRRCRCPDRNLLVLADEATSANCANGIAYTWVIDVRAPENPVSIATLPTPAEEDFCAKGAQIRAA